MKRGQKTHHSIQANASSAFRVLQRSSPSNLNVQDHKVSTTFRHRPQPIVNSSSQQHTATVPSRLREHSASDTPNTPNTPKRRIPKEHSNTDTEPKRNHSPTLQPPTQHIRHTRRRRQPKHPPYTPHRPIPRHTNNNSRCTKERRREEERAEDDGVDGTEEGEGGAGVEGVVEYAVRVVG